MYTNKKRIEMYIFINIYTYYINRKYHIRNTSYSLCSFRPMLKSVIFLSVSTILVCFSVHGNAGWLLQRWRPSRNRGRKKKKIIKKGPTSLKTNEHRGFYPGSERYRECHTKMNKTNKKKIWKKASAKKRWYQDHKLCNVVN